MTKTKATTTSLMKVALTTLIATTIAYIIITVRAITIFSLDTSLDMSLRL